MTLAEVLPGARQLSPAEKLKLIRILVEDLDDKAEGLGDDELGFNNDRFRESWKQAITGQTLPLSQLWED
jgi:hypothetical protein